MSMIRVAIVEDDKEILRSLLNLLADDPDIMVTRTCLNAESFVAAFP
jgi:hypothetical protein